MRHRFAWDDLVMPGPAIPVTATRRTVGYGRASRISRWNALSLTRCHMGATTQRGGYLQLLITFSQCRGVGRGLGARRDLGVGVALGVGLCVGAAVGVGVTIGVAVGVGVVVGTGVGDEVAVGDAVAVGVAEGVGIGVPVGLGVGVVESPCTSKEPMSIRALTTRAKAGPR